MKTPATALALLFTGIALAQESGSADAQSPRSDVLEVRLTPQLPSAAERLHWSPKGRKVTLVAVAVAGEHGERLAGRLALGPRTPAGAQAAVPLELTKSAGSTHFERLWIDRNRDGRHTPDEDLATTVSQSRGKFWSSFEATLKLGLASGKGTRAYPLSLWYVENPAEPTAAPVLRWSRRGWHAGKIALAGESIHVLICERQQDGVFDEADAWALASTHEALLSADTSRPLARHAWLGERAFRLVAVDPDGLWIRLAPFDPGVTRAEEEAAEDRLAADRNAERAKAPLAFGHDFEVMLKRAKREGKMLLVDFETTWCGPCKAMDAIVYTAKRVVDTARAAGVIAVKVDGDEHPELKERFGVEAFPTMILLDAKGAELRRKVGYLGVAGMEAFLLGQE